MLLIFASEVAAFIGKNPYKPQWEAFEKVWARVRSDQYAEDSVPDVVAAELDKVQERMVTAACETAAQPTSTVHDVQIAEKQVVQALEEHVKQESKARILQAASLLNVPLDAHSADANVPTLQELAKENENEAAAKLLDEAVQLVKKQADTQSKAASGIRCAFGTAKEDKSREQLVKSTGVEVEHTNRFYKLRLGIMPYAQVGWGIGGRLDGLDAQGRVVEIKNRTRRFFTVIPEYERIQVACYMKLLNTRRAVIVQQFNGEQRRTDVEQDDDAWATYYAQLTHVVQVLDLFMSEDSITLRRAWGAGTGEEKQDLLRHWLADASNV